VIIISIRQAKNNDRTKDGKSWFVDLAYKDLFGKKHRIILKNLQLVEKQKTMKQNIK